MAVSAANGHGKSMAIWFPLKSVPVSAISTVATLHFNLWRLGHRGQEAKNSAVPDLLDIGIMVSSPANLAAVKFYLPIVVDRDHVEDLGPKFKESALATGIFNEQLSASNGHSGNLIILEDRKQDRYCAVFSFAQQHTQISPSDLAIVSEYDGTTFTITKAAISAACSHLDPDDKLYFRLRIKIPKKEANAFINAAVPDDRWFTSGVDITEYLDFRLNQARNLNPGIVRQLTAEVGINRLDFLLVVGVAVDVVVGHPEFHKCRLLEKDLWKSYVDETHLRKGMVIYHWKDVPLDGALTYFNAFVKLRLRLSGWRITMRYLVFAALFGVVVGVCGNTTYEAGKWLVESILGTSAKLPPAACSPPVAGSSLEVLPPKAAVQGGKVGEHG